MKTQNKFSVGTGDLPLGDALRNTGASAVLAEEFEPDAAMVVTSGQDAMAGALTEGLQFLRFIQGGNAIFTIRAKATGVRFTFKFARPKEGNPAMPHHPRPIWVSVLSGASNDSDYSFIGTIQPFPGNWALRASSRSKVKLDSPSGEVAQWIVKSVNLGLPRLFRQANVWHEGRCGRCGRRLTVPSSVESGFGPECAGRV